MQRKPINVLSWNLKGYKETINGLQVNKFECKEIISKLASYEIVFIQETHLGKEQSKTIVLPGFSSTHYIREKKARAVKCSGGISVFIREELKKHVKILPQSNSDIVWLKFTNSFSQEHVSDTYIGCVYIPPEHSSFGKVNTAVIWQNLQSDVEQFCLKGTVLLCGDFNARTGTLTDYILMDSDKNVYTLPHNYQYNLVSDRCSMDKTIQKNGRQLVNICIENNLCMLNGRTLGDLQGRFTCHTPNGSSVVDYFIASQSLFPHISRMEVNNFGLYSDHCPISTTIHLFVGNANERRSSFSSNPSSQTNVHLGKIKHNYSHKTYIWEKTSSDKFKLALNTPDIASTIPVIKKSMNDVLNKFTMFPQQVVDASQVNKDEVNDAVKSLNEIFHKAAQLSLTSKHRVKARKIRLKHNHKKWFDQDCNKLRREVKSLLNAINRYPLEKKLREKFFSKRKLYNKLLKRKKRVFKQKLVDALNEALDKDPDSVWKTLHGLKESESPISDKGKHAVTAGKWIQHLEQLLSSAPSVPAERMREVTGKLDTLLKGEQGSYLDAPITQQEIFNACKNLKTKKSPGVDYITNEMIKASLPILNSLFEKMFNIVLQSGVYPDIWKTGINVPIFKAGDPYNPSNYRGITLNSSLGKLFCQVINNRVVSFLESRGLFAKEQAGFRKHQRTTDQIFILKQIIDHALKSRNGRLYCCFVDFQKAFDNVWHEALLLKLQDIGIHGKCFGIIKAMYDEATVYARSGDTMTHGVQVKRGVHQGNTLSPTLFNIFINDIVKCMQGNESPQFGSDVSIPCLMYADDIAVLSTTKAGMQHKLDLLNAYCKEWALAINPNKTKVVVFSKCDPKVPMFFKCGDHTIATTDQYKYLGIIFHKSGNFHTAQEHLAQQARKATFSVKRAFKGVNENPSVITKLFDSLISPIATYGAEVWLPYSIKIPNGQKNLDKTFEQMLGGALKCESLHIQFCKHLIGVHKKAMNLPILGELGRFPISLKSFCLVIQFWLHITCADDNSYLSRIYKCLSQEPSGASAWLTFVENVLNVSGYRHVWANQTTFSISSLKYSLLRQLQDRYKTFWKNKKKEYSRLLYYNAITAEYGFQPYLTYIINRRHRYALTRLRVSAHDLEIERGRFSGQERSERRCTTCGVLEDELHFLDACNRFSIARTRLQNSISIPGTMPSHLVCYDDRHSQSLLSRFIFESFQLRSGKP